MRRRAAALLISAAVIAGCGSDDPGGYDLATEQAFIDQCAQSADRQACRCIYLRIVDEIPYERFVELDRQRADDPTFVPAEIEEFALDCAFGLAE
ncbi:MAG TPA: hypothetical protein VMW08_04190 [Acidimicrobiales bacterium]|nr:hypothetical protein [Acidimicrobiales bacterium]